MAYPTSAKQATPPMDASVCRGFANLRAKSTALVLRYRDTDPATSLRNAREQSGI